MASKSGGEIPPRQQIADANQAIALLDSMHHWSSTRVTHGNRRGYQICITHAGRRVRVNRVSFVDAVITALAQLRGKPVMRKASFMRMAD